MSRAALYINALFLVSINLVTATNLAYDGGFDRHECYERTLSYLGNQTLAPDDDVFYRDPFGRPLNSKNDLTLTLTGCEKLCGPKQVWYSDIGPRLSIWLIPILLLISNVELSPLDKRRFLAILHLLGDPIDSIWSLAHKIDCWRRCHDLADQYEDVCDRCKRVMGTVFAGFEELEGPNITSEAAFHSLVDRYPLTTHFREWRRTAIKLADSRTDEFFRTCLAILLYIFQLIAGFVKQVGGGNSSPPGGRIATGVFLSWVIPMALLSNAIGSFPSRRTCYVILDRFTKDTGEPLYLPRQESVFLPGFSSLARRRSTNYFQSLAWSGGIYTFRPWKYRDFKDPSRRNRALFLLLLSTSPLWISLFGAFIILWYSIPTGLNCRHTWLVGISLAWCMSAFITWISHSPKFATGEYHWHFVLCKDAFVALPSILIIFLSACGLFNFCYCWSGFLVHRSKANVPLNADPYYMLNDRTIYPGVVGISTALQLAFFLFTAFIWRPALRLFRWSEAERSTEWKRMAGYKTCKCMAGKNIWRPERKFSKDTYPTL